MNAYGQVFTITAEDNDQDDDYNNASGAYIDLPFLVKNGYDWYQYVTVDG